MKKLKSITIIFACLLISRQIVFAQEKRVLISKIPIEQNYQVLEAKASLAIKQKLSQLRLEGVQKNWTFQVVATEVASYDLKSITGGEEPSAETQSSGGTQNNQPPPMGGNIADANARSFDLRSLGLVSNVRMQWLCGSCWAMAAIATTESAHILKNKVKASLINLSVEQVLNCSMAGKCSGGKSSKALEYLKYNFVSDEFDYGYTAMDATCLSKPQTKYKVENWGWVGNSSKETPTRAEIKNAIVKFGAVGSSMWANAAFQVYGSGVYNNNTRNPDGAGEGGHAVQIIGWNDDLAAWLIKNSWSTNWGMGGFAWIDYNTLDIGKWCLWTVANSISSTNKVTSLPTSGNRTVRGYFSWSDFNMHYPLGTLPENVFDLSVKQPAGIIYRYRDSYPEEAPQTFTQEKIELSPGIILDTPVRVSSSTRDMMMIADRVYFTVENLPDNTPLTIAVALKTQFLPGTKALVNKGPEQKETNFYVTIKDDYDGPLDYQQNDLVYPLQYSFFDHKKLNDKIKTVPKPVVINSNPDPIIKPATDIKMDTKQIRTKIINAPIKQQ